MWMPCRRNGLNIILMSCAIKYCISYSRWPVITQSDVIWRQDSNMADGSVQSFLASVKDILVDISSGWENTVVFPEFVVSFLVASDTLPSAVQFERFIASNKYFDPSRIIKWTTWNQYISNNDRKAFEQHIRNSYLPTYQMFSYASDGSKLPTPPNASQDYSPIIYCSPRTDELVGFDVYNDPIEGSAIRTASTTGRPVSRAPFLLRGLSPDTQFRNGTLLSWRCASQQQMQSIGTK
jgi:hypothetical protein